jgi:hypothetical protein
MAIQQWSRQKANPLLLETLIKLPLVGETVSSEDEYEVNLGSPKPYPGSARKKREI